MGVLHNEVLWLWCHNSDSIHSCKCYNKQKAKDAANIIQLLAPACTALRNPCLTGPITTYEWAEGIPLMTIFVLFFVELMAMRYATFGHNHDDGKEPGDHHDSLQIHSRSSSNAQRHTPGEDHLGHTREHIEHEEHDIETSPNGLAGTIYSPHEVEDYAAQMTAIFILEFGVIFHSIFIGLTLAVAGSEFNILYVVLAFHQTFEGLGLGSRLAATPWPKSKRWTPYLFALGYGMSTPLAIAVGLGVRKSYIPGSQTSLIVSGVFDSISAGILIYTGLVELMAHEFMFSSFMRRARLRIVLYAFGMMCLGAGESPFPTRTPSIQEPSANIYRSGLMACLGRWA